MNSAAAARFVPMVVLSTCAIATLLGFAWLARAAGELGGINSGIGSDSIPVVLAIALVLLIPSAVVMFILPRLGSSGIALGCVFLVGLLLRVMFFPLEPGFTDDFYRYLWDGRVQASHINPYGVAPSDPALDRVENPFPKEDHVRGLVNHPQIPTVYPPQLELTFATVQRLDQRFDGVPNFGLRGGLFMWKLFLLVADVCMALLLIRALEGMNSNRCWLILYWWHPLPVIETTWNAHAELIPVLFFVWCSVLLTEERRGLAGVALGGAIAAKVLPIGFLVTLFRRGKGIALMLCFATLCWLSTPFFGVDLHSALAGLSEYAESWYFNDLVYRPLGNLLQLDPENRHSSAAQLLRMVLGIGWVSVVLMSSSRSPYSAALALTGGFVILSPTVHPWYLLWVLPFAALLRQPAWWLLAGTTLIAYEVVIGWRAAGVWEPAEGTRWLVYAAPLGLMLWGFVREILDRRETRRLLAEIASPDEHS